VTVPRLTISSFTASSGSIYDSVNLSVIPGSNILWSDTKAETVIIDRRVSGGTPPYTYTAVSTDLNFWPSSGGLTTPRTGVDNASDGLLTTGSYIYRINITGGYFGTKVYRHETTSSANPGNSGNLGTLSATVSGDKVELAFSGGSNYNNAKITVQYKLDSIADWDGTGVTTVQLTLDNDGKASFAKPAAGTYDIRYKYKNADPSDYATSTFTVAP
jgi:hypothetical protein